MARTITLDSVEPTQIILMKQPGGNKILVQVTYRVKAGSEVVKTVLDRQLSFVVPGPEQPLLNPPTDILSSTEQSAASSAWEGVVAALRRLEL